MQSSYPPGAGRPVDDLRRLPDALLPLVKERRWVVWRWTFIAQRDKWTKVPYQPHRPHQKARSNDPATWGAHEAAVAVVARREADGIGYELAGGDIAAFDLDDCRDPETGEIAAWARTLVEETKSYTELTVSGAGLRILGRATGEHVHRKLPAGDGVGSLELYRKASRFIVVSGVPVAGASMELADIDGAIGAALARYDRDPGKSSGSDRTGSETLDFNDPAASAPASTTNDVSDLPPALLDLVRNGAPDGERSDQFHHTVGWLKDRGWTRDRIVELLERHPNGIAAKYAGRLRAEVERSFDKVGASGEAGAKNPEKPRIAPIPLHWHGDPDDTAERKWLVTETIPETGKGLLSGQWGTGKTFVALDLAGSVMTGAPFAGRAVTRIGGVLFIAAEGANEVSVRLRGVVDHKLVEQPSIDPAKLDRLPFAWIDECPALTDREALPTLKATVAEAAERMLAQFNLPLALIVVDTLMAAADFEDENDSAQGQKVMRVLEELSRWSGAFALAVDHFGKAVETGTRGTSAKEGAADAVLALLGDKDIAGTVSNRRMAIRKLRGGATGSETAFELRQVTFDPDRPFGATTTCIVTWDEAGSGGPKRKAQTAGTRHFMKALLNALLEHGENRWPFGSKGPLVKAVAADRVREEFIVSYVADADTAEQKANTKRKAYQRALSAALAAGLIGCRELSGTEYVWAIHEDRTGYPQGGTGQDTP